ncbi:MAG: SDR family NAD(P)-dependent oxidoreductase [Pseudomonadota bacterium]
MRTASILPFTLISKLETTQMYDDHSINSASEQRPGASRRSVILGAGATAVAAATTMAETATAADKVETREMEGKTAFITGGARGIGLSSADLLARSGANIVIYDVARNLEHVDYDMSTEADMAVAKAQIEAHGVQCMTVQGDVRDRSGLVDAMQQATAVYGSLDHVLVNAGITQAGAIDSLGDESVQTVVDINIVGATRTIQAAVPIMQEQKSGSIVVISSILGRRPNEWYSVYGASKWAVIGLAKATSLAMAPHSVTCNVICPTLVDTPLARSLAHMFNPQNPTWEAVEEVMRNINPLPVAAFQPEDVAQLVKFFASGSAKHITGEVFNLDAGSLAAATV